MSDDDGINVNANGDEVVGNISKIKLPPFWHSKPEIWFTQVEAQFTISHITSDKSK